MMTSRRVMGLLTTLALLFGLGVAPLPAEAVAPLPRVEVRGNLVTVSGNGRAATLVMVNHQPVKVVGTSSAGWSATVAMPSGRYSAFATVGGQRRGVMAQVRATNTAPTRSTYGKAVLKRVPDPNPIDPAQPTMETIDIPTTIARLKGMGVNEYMYLIYNWRPRFSVGTDEQIRSSDRWQKLPVFATAARAAGINVKVYLVPPTGTDDIAYLPFGLDYRRWVVEIGKLARQHPNIRGLVMDDMRDVSKITDGSVVRPTPARLAVWMSEARRQAPWLTFQTVYYAVDLIGGERSHLPTWRSVIDGVVHPYRGSADELGKAANTTEYANAATTVDRAATAVNCPRTDLTCIQMDMRATVPTNAGTWMTADVRIGADRRVSVWASAAVPLDRRPHGARMRLRVGNVDLGTAALHDGRQRYDFYAPANLAGKTVRVTVEVSRLVAKRGTWMVNVPTGSSGAGVIGGHLRMGPLRWSKATATNVKPIDVTTMVYAMRLYAERNNPRAASPTYVDKVMGEVTWLQRRGLIDGAVAYCANVAGIADGIRYGGHPGTYAVMAKHYAQWR